MKLMVNGDDFGFSEGQNLGIIKAHKDGILTSTSVMANGEWVEEGLTLARNYPSLAIGVHLIIDCGIPLLDKEKIKTLVDADGYFLHYRKDAPMDVNVDEVFMEWCAQIDKIISLNVKPSHLDGHHHMHLHPFLLETTLKVAEKYQLPIRYFPFHHEERELQMIKDTLVKTYSCLTDFYQEGVNESYFDTFKEKHLIGEEEMIEVMCHPAYLDDVIYSRSSYNIHRVKELVVLINPSVKKSLRTQGISLVNLKNSHS